jgi:hypothetical protein
MLVTFGTFNSRAGTAALEYALRYLVRRHPDANAFRRLEQRLRDTGSVTPRANVNASGDATVGAVEREPWRGLRDIAREPVASQPRDLEVLHDAQLR